MLPENVSNDATYNRIKIIPHSVFLAGLKSFQNIQQANSKESFNDLSQSNDRVTEAIKQGKPLFVHHICGGLEEGVSSHI